MSKRKDSNWVFDEKFVLLSQFPADNLYFNFIDFLRDQQVFGPNVEVEKHHIIPISHAGPDTPENIIKVTRAQHLEAHRLLAELTNNEVDKTTYRMMSGLTNDEYVKAFRKAGAITSHNVQRQNKTGWFSPESQREKGKLSAQAPGSIVFSHEKAVNLGRSSKKNKMFPENTKFILSRAHQEIFCITGCSSSADILAVTARIDSIIAEK